MKWFKRKVKTPERTGRVIDMTRKYWGHNFEVMSEKDETFRAAIWVGKRPAKGDILRWRSAEHGEVDGIVLAVEAAQSVYDMSFVDVQILGLTREVSPSTV